MTTEKRLFRRLPITGVNVLIYFGEDYNNIEVNGIVNNISEEGIGIKILDEIPKINENTEVKLVFCDEVHYEGINDDFVIMCNCKVKHCSKRSSNLILGGSIDNVDFHKYYLAKELQTFSSIYCKGALK